ncbi:MAG: molecular chaperone DnaJ, partial [Thermomicrobiaceae bacterium]|nr:molecular chaperone DnaJ [Thermomicrobiaceae bacterium]
MLPARVDELERVNLDLELRRRVAAVEDLQRAICEEEAAQQALRRLIEERVGSLRSEIERLRAEVERLERRLERLTHFGGTVPEEDLDREEARARAEDAAWWAEWRHRRAERRDLRGEMVYQNGDDDISLRQIYRALARLVHPDLARDPHDRARREMVMRLANAAKEARDVDQLRRLLAMWSRPEEGEHPREVDTLRARIAQTGIEAAELRRRLNQLRGSSLGRLARRGDAEVRQYLRSEEARLSRE